MRGFYLALSMLFGLVLAHLGKRALFQDNINQPELSPRVESEKSVSNPKARNGLSGSVTSSVGREPASLYEAVRAKYDELESCYTQKCNFSDEDPRAYDLAVQKAQSAALLPLVKQFFESPSQDTVVQAFAVRLLASQSPFVQQRALEILSTQDPSALALEQLLQKGILSTSPKIVSMTMDELLKYVGTAFEPLAHEHIAKTLLQADRITAQHILSRLDPFLNKQSHPLYRNLQGKLPFDDLNRRLVSLLRSSSERI